MNTDAWSPGLYIVNFTGRQGPHISVNRMNQNRSQKLDKNSLVPGKIIFTQNFQFEGIKSRYC